jgi:hypothetical protein
MNRLAATAVTAGGLVAALAVASPPATAVSATSAATCSPVGGLLAKSAVDALGFRVGISAAGTTAIASATQTGNYAGMVKVYAKSGGRWHTQATWTEPIARRAGNFFGEGVGVTSTAAVVGAPGHYYVNSKGVREYDAGAVYFYARSRKNWHLESAWVGTKANEFLGYSVAIAANTAVVGAPGSGRAILFVSSGNKWNPTVVLIPGGSVQGALGASVAISGSVVVAGDPYHDGHGIAYVFERSGKTWRYSGPLIDPAPAVNDHFANVLGVSGNTIVVGTAYTCDATGAVFIYGRTATGWHRQATLKNPRPRAGDNFGWGVAISGTRVLVGAPVMDEHPAAHCGTAYEFVRVGRSWPERSQVADPGCSVDDYFGDSVALAGQSAIIGAPGTRKLDGAVYVLTVP